MIVYGSTRLTDTASLTATASHGTISPNILPALHRGGVLPARVSARALGPEPLAQASRRQAGGSDAIDRNGRPASFRCAGRRPCLAPLPRDQVISLISLAYVEEDGLLLSVGLLAATILIGLGSAAVWGTVIGATLISGYAIGLIVSVTEKLHHAPF